MPMDRKEYQKNYRDTHREYFRNYHRESYKKHRDKILARKKAYRLRNLNTFLEYQKNYRETHRESLKDYNQSYYQLHKEKINSRGRDNYYKRKSEQSEQEPPSVVSDPVPVDPWYDGIRLNILKGISTSTLSEEERNRWWSMHLERVKAEYIETYGQWRNSNEIPNAFVF
jgi:hypothetical protein